MAYSYHPFPVVAVIKSVIFTVVLLVFVFLLRDFLGDFTLIVSLIVIALGFLQVSQALLVAQTYRVILGDNGITFTTGLFARREIILPYAQVTEASYSQGILQRIFGIGNINIDTPGGSNMALFLPDVRYSDIKRTMDRIHSYKK